MEKARPDLPTLTLVTFLCLFCMGLGWSPEVQGRQGGEVELDCSLPPPGPSRAGSASPHVVEWVRRGFDIPVLMKFGVYAPRVHPKYEGRVTLVRSTSLRLQGLRVEDEGVYECRLLLLDDHHAAEETPTNGSWTQLSVTAPPTFTKTPPSVMETLVGSRLSLSCVANGNPSPSITWLKDGAGLQDEDVEVQGGALLLRAVTPQLGGQYGCRASNPEGNITHVTTLQVKGPPVIVIPPKSTSLNMSQNALLRCQATADPPNMTYVWRKGRENVHHVESLKSRVKIMVDGTLLISRLTPEDSGKYTCMPTNGLLVPPTASADLTVMHPALALPMPGETYLPTGMRGLITCPSSANPPLLHVDWTKDGSPLDLTLYPGWTLSSEGSLSMATVNEDSMGVYVCTPTNGFGSMGSSGPTQVLLQDPPWFRTAPQPQYQQEVGGALLIPCQGEGGPDTRVTWRKLVPGPRASSGSQQGVTARNGSLLLQPLTKDQQGAWECRVTNRVASVNATTRVLVLGTTPHAATSLSVVPGPRVANVSWEPGFDGGSAQTFSVWVKQISPLNSNNHQHHDDADDNSDDDQMKKKKKKKEELPQDWFSVSVPPSSGPHHLVRGLSPTTKYQFSVLAQNAAGTGPFSELVSVRTLDAPIPRRAWLSPPGALSVNLTLAGVILHWAPSPAQHPPITALVLQARPEHGEWLVLDRDVDANASEVVVPGLRKDNVYELRLLSRRGGVLSEPSPSVTVSTVGLGVQQVPSQQSELLPWPLLAGILGGVVFMALLLLPAAASCYVRRRREKRRRKLQQQNDEELVPAIYKCPAIRTPGSGSPDSVLKKSLLRSHNLYPTTSSTSSTTSSASSSSSSSSSQSPSGYFGKGSPPDYQEQHMELLSAPTHHHHLPRHPSSPRRINTLTRAAPASVVSSHLELISRGPDGRFAAPPDDQSLSPVLDDEKTPAPRRGGGGGRSGRGTTTTFQRSASLPSSRRRRRGDGKPPPPFVLSVELPPLDTATAKWRRRSMTEQHLPSRQGRCLSDDTIIDCDASCDGGSDWKGVLRSSGLASTLPPGAGGGSRAYPTVKPVGRASTTASTLVLQMEHEKERGNLSRCLQLAQEREQLEWQLRKCMLERNAADDWDSRGGGGGGGDVAVDLEVEDGEELVTWQQKSDGDYYLHCPPQGSGGSCDLPSSLYAPWGVPPPPPLTPASAWVPVLNPCRPPPHGASFRSSRQAQRPLSSPVQLQVSAGGRSEDRFTLPHLSAERQPHGRARERQGDCDNSRETRQWNDSPPEAGRRKRNLSTPSSVHDDKYAEHSNAAGVDVPLYSKAHTGVPGAASIIGDTCVEMSVDGPELEMTPPAESVAQDRAIASSLRRQPKGATSTVSDRGSKCLTPSPGQSCSFEMTPRASASRTPARRHLWKSASLCGPESYDYHQRSRSLDSRKHRQAKFLTPDAWVDSLSQENCSTPLDRQIAGTLLRGPQSTSMLQTPIPFSPSSLSLRSMPPKTPSPPDCSSSPSPSPSSTQTPNGEPPSLRTSPPMQTQEAAATTPPQSRDSKREWSILSPDALRWPTNRPEPPWASGPRADAVMESGGGSVQDGGPRDGEEEDLRGFPRPLHRGLGWPPTDLTPPPPPPPLSHGDGDRRDDDEEDEEDGNGDEDNNVGDNGDEEEEDADVDIVEGRHGDEVDDTRGYVMVHGPAARGSFSSYSSSGRGSMETANGRLSICLSPTLSKSPDEIEEYAEDCGPDLDDASRRRKASVDESYEWDEVASLPPTREAQFQELCASRGEQQKGVSCCGPVSMQTCDLTDCSLQTAALLRGCGTNGTSSGGGGGVCPPQVEMETVLF